jgi:hypothetical protein
MESTLAELQEQAAKLAKAGAERLTAYVLERTNPEEEDTDELDKDLVLQPHFHVRSLRW